MAADDRQSAEWFRRAAEQGHPQAQGHLGLRYAEGRGVARDDVQAMMWTTLAANQGNPAAIENKRVLLRRLSPDTVSRANKLVEAWRPKPSAQP